VGTLRLAGPRIAGAGQPSALSFRIAAWLSPLGADGLAGLVRDNPDKFGPAACQLASCPVDLRPMGPGWEVW